MPQEVDVHQLHGWLKEGKKVRLIDVRQEWEAELAELPESRLIPLNQLTVRAEEIEPEEDAPLVVYCHHGMRSLSGAALLEHLGHKEVLSLAGGIDAWSLHVDPSVPRY